VLVRGESGSGKELVAGAIHALSERAKKHLIARNAATIPPALIDAELFGNIKDYPNPGMPERKGMIGEAHGSTLFLDEIGEIPEEMQAHLLRVLDAKGEYHRLGESRPATSDFRLVGATNRPLSALKHDILARLKLQVEVPDLNERREDIPLLVHHLLRKAALEDGEIAERFFEGRPGGAPRLSSQLVARLLSHRYTHHVRELDAVLWRSLASSPGPEIELTSEVLEALSRPPTHSSAGGKVRPEDLDPATVQEALDRHGGVQERVWPELGLKNRFQLMRLIKKHNLRLR
jgi:DNA-binding NtrC family response regulator